MAENSVGRGRCPDARVTQNAQGCQNCQLLKLSIFLNFFFARTIFALPSTKKPNLGSSWSIHLRGVSPRTTTFAIPWNHTGACGSDEREREVFFAKGFEISSTANVASLCGHFWRVMMNIGLQMLQWGGKDGSS